MYAFNLQTIAANWIIVFCMFAVKFVCFYEGKLEKIGTIIKNGAYDVNQLVYINKNYSLNTLLRTKLKNGSINSIPSIIFVKENLSSA